MLSKSIISESAAFIAGIVFGYFVFSNWPIEVSRRDIMRAQDLCGTNRVVEITTKSVSCSDLWQKSE